MPGQDTHRSLASKLRGSRLGLQLPVLHMSPAKLLLLGYTSYVLLGWVLLCLPVAQAAPVSALDALFIATSAVSTTGLITVDPGGSFTFLGELVVLPMIQVGGLGYMTVGSFLVLAVTSRLSRARSETTREVFHLPQGIRPARFIRWVVLFTLICEAVGAAALYPIFRAAEVETPLWSAVFHSVSAFCTAGFSLNADSFESFRNHTGLNLIIAALSLLGAIGFLIVWDVARALTARKTHLGFTTKVITRVTTVFVLCGTLIVYVTEPALGAMPPPERLLAAFFQVMSAATTVGFNTVPIGGLSLAVLVLLFLLMVVGASPAGTGGGLKTTSFAVLVGLVRSTLRGRDGVRFFNRTIPAARVQSATAVLSYYLTLMLLATFLLALTEPAAAFEVILLEVISALGTVGLSMGITGDLSSLGKLIVIALMLAGRIGILTFGIALASEDETQEEVRDNDLVL